MLGFFSKVEDPSEKVNNNEIYFVSCADNLSTEEKKMTLSSKAQLFANKLNINEVFLHFGKETIKYDFKV